MTEKPVVGNQALKHPLSYRGKVRDLYDLGDRLLMVATDRISAFDIPAHGRSGQGKDPHPALRLLVQRDEIDSQPFDIHRRVALCCQCGRKADARGRTMVMRGQAPECGDHRSGLYHRSAFKDYTKTGIVNGMKNSLTG
jgi:phosphoribosylaminoimidazole-succinocarboxamide synthase